MRKPWGNRRQDQGRVCHPRTIGSESRACKSAPPLAHRPRPTGGRCTPHARHSTTRPPPPHAHACEPEHNDTGAKTPPQPPTGGRGSPAPHKGLGTYRQEQARAPPQPPAGGRDSPAPHKGSGAVQTQGDPADALPLCWLAGVRSGGVGGRGCGPGSCVRVYVRVKGRQPTRPYLVQ